MVTAVLYTKRDALKFLKHKPNVDRVYPLTPDAKAEILNCSLPILDHVEVYKDDGHKKVLVHLQRLENDVFLHIENQNLSEAAKETFRTFLHNLFCSNLFLWYSIKGMSPLCIFNGKKWVTLDDINKAHNILFEQIALSREGNFLYMYITNPGSITTILYKIINKIVLHLVKNKNCIWTTGHGYGLKNIIEKIHCGDRSIYFLSFSGVRAHRQSKYKHFLSNHISFAKALLTLMKSILGKKNKFILFPIPNNKTNVYNNINEVFREIGDPIIYNGKKVFFEVLNKTVGYTESLVEHTCDVFAKSKSKTLISHQSKVFEGTLLSEAALKVGANSILISHGSHTYQENEFANYEHKDLARGLLYSPLVTTQISQSPIANQAANKFVPQVSMKKYHPIMWGYNNFIENNDKISNERIILHAGTYKVMGNRPWIYESSSEYLRGLILLIEAIDKLKDTKLIIRVRGMDECSVSTLSRLLPSLDTYEINAEGSFLNDLSKADLLVSFSSTTIEEALNLRKPVGLFGGTSRYRHLPGSESSPTKNQRSAVYHLKENNLSTMLDSILEVHKQSPLTNDELKGYTWPKSVPGLDNFIEDIIV